MDPCRIFGDERVNVFVLNLARNTATKVLALAKRRRDPNTYSPFRSAIPSATQPTSIIFP